MNGEQQERTHDEQRQVIRDSLQKTKEGAVRNTIRNCLTVLEQDPVLKDGIAYNVMAGQKYVVKDLGWFKDVPTFTDTDLANIQLYMEDHYSLTSREKIEKAIDVAANSRQFHPVRECLNSLVWDGQERIKDCLRHFLGVTQPDCPEYPGEALKLFMLGAIHRVFCPGCKFEIILCLVGGQGAGKSTFLRFLAIRDEWFSDDLKKLSDEKVYNKILGIWIIEFSEMLATANARSVEEIKSFISRQSDNFRTAYEKYPKQRPRQCVFAGSSNTFDFLPLDHSGNRRFVPIIVDMEKADCHILDDEEASREYIRQMWAEAMTIYRGCGGNPKLTFDREMSEYLRDYQQNFMPEDTDIGLILDYLDKKTDGAVCSLQIYCEALNHEPGTQKQWQLRQISAVMNGPYVTGWRKFDNPRSFGQYGRQKGWERILPSGKEEDEEKPPAYEQITMEQQRFDHAKPGDPEAVRQPAPDNRPLKTFAEPETRDGWQKLGEDDELIL